MTKENEDVILEKKFRYENFTQHYSKPNRRTVYIRRKVGRKNPDVIKTENFDFAKLTDTIGKISDTVEKAGSVVKNVQSTVQNVKDTVKTVQSIPSITAPSQYGPTITSQYPGYYNPQTPVYSDDVLGFFSYPENRWILYVVAAIIIFFLIKTFKK